MVRGRARRALAHDLGKLARECREQCSRLFTPGKKPKGVVPLEVGQTLVLAGCFLVELNYLLRQTVVPDAKLLFLISNEAISES